MTVIREGTGVSADGKRSASDPTKAKLRVTRQDIWWCGKLLAHVKRTWWEDGHVIESVF